MDALQILRLIFIDETISDVRISIKDSDNHINIWNPSIMEDVGMYMDKHSYTKLTLLEMKIKEGKNGTRGSVFMSCRAE